MYMPVNAMVLYVSSVQTILFSNPNLNLFPILNGPKKKKIIVTKIRVRRIKLFTIIF